jgi:3-hydroxybutyryl-CoA dehydrogenase
MTSATTAIVAVGAGRMGRGIAHVFAYAGHPVTILDLKARPPDEAEALLGAARTEIRANLEFVAALLGIGEAQIAAILARVSTATAADAERVLGAAEIIFEGAPETKPAKRDALARIGALARPEAVIASATSTMLVDELAAHVAAPERFMNAHWLNPAYLIPLVEVSPGARTDEAAVARLMELLESVGKVPVRCKASPGYIVPRIQAIAMNEAARMVEEGVASAEDIDKAIRVGFGVRYATMGLVEFIDWGGVDILLYASDYLSGALDSDRFEAPAVIREMVESGRSGMGKGGGFYGAHDSGLDEFQREKLSRFVGLLKHLDLLPKPAAEDESGGG